MTQVDIILLVIGGLVLALGLISRLSSRGPITDLLAALVIRMMIGPVGFGVLGPASWGDSTLIMEGAAEVTLAVLGLANLLGMSGVFAVFVTGVAFDASAPQEQQKEYEIHEAVNRFFLLPVFVLFGMLVPWEAWWDLGWRGVLIVVLILLVRRLPAMLLFAGRMPILQHRRDAWFLGWFGPIGVPALYYASIARHEAGLEQAWVASPSAVQFWHMECPGDRWWAGMGNLRPPMATAPDGSETASPALCFRSLQPLVAS